VVLPSLRRTKIKSIIKAGRSLEIQELKEASSREAVVLQLEDQIDISRGDMLVRPKNVPRVVTGFEAMVVWLGDTPMDPATKYVIRHTTRETRGFISGVEYKIDIHTLGRIEATPLSTNEIGRVAFTTTAPLFLDPYQKNRATGNFIVIDPATFSTVGAGMIIDRATSGELPDGEESLPAPESLHKEAALVSQTEREARSGARAVTLWLTGLSGSGKSTIAKGVERVLFDQEIPIFFLDGDNVRHGLNKDLGFSASDRSENIRRVAEVAAILNKAGTSVICSLISPYRADREAAREIIGADRFVEIFVKAPLEVCEKRDLNGLYARARKGEIKNFTGISDPYEMPETPDLVVATDSLSVDEAVRSVAALALEKTRIKS
jgi:bifunctional enzyme CysN/CysC